MSPSLGRRGLLLWAAGVSVVLLHLVLAYRWIAVETRPPAWDQAVHLGTAQDYRDDAARGAWGKLLIARPRPGHPPYPPLYHFSLIPVLGTERPHVAAAAMNLVYFFLLVFSCAWIAYLLGGEIPAATTLLVVGLSAHIIEIFREPFPDLPMTALVALAYALILRSGRFEDRRWSAAAGLCAGLALLSKWSAFVYLIPGAAAGLSDDRRRRNLLFALAPAVLVPTPWYAINGGSVLPRVWTSMNLGAGEGDPSFRTVANWLFYPKMTAMLFGTAASLLMAVGAVRSFWTGRRAERAMLAAWLIFSYAAWSVVSNKDNRYFLPAVVALPALGLSALPAPLLALSAALAVAGAREMPRPVDQPWPLEEILRAAQSRRGPDKDPAVICVLANHSQLNATSLVWLARHWGLRQLAFGGSQTEIPEWSDFVLLKTDSPGPYISDGTRAILAQTRDPRSFFHKVFKEAGRWPLPDGSTALLFEQHPAPPLLARRATYPGLKVREARLENVRVSPSGPGRYAIDADVLRLSKLDAPVRGVRVALEGARFFEHGDKVFIGGIRTLRIVSGRASWKELSDALSRRAHLPVALAPLPGGLRVSLGKAALSADLGVEVREDRVRLRLAAVRLLNARIPFVQGLSREISLDARAPKQPFAIRMPQPIFGPDGLSFSDVPAKG